MQLLDCPLWFKSINLKENVRNRRGFWGLIQRTDVPLAFLGLISLPSFPSLRIPSFKLQNSDLTLHPGQGVRASLSNTYVSVRGNWKVQKSFM